MDFDENDARVLSTVAIAAFAAMGVIGICVAVQQSVETRYALENGYEQVVDENGRLLWKQTAETDE